MQSINQAYTWFIIEEGREITAVKFGEIAQDGRILNLPRLYALNELENFCDVIGILHENKIVLEKNLDDIKENIHKIQVAFKPMIDVSSLKGIDIVKSTVRKSIMEIVARGRLDDILRKIEEKNPILTDVIDISLEDIFIYEMEVTGYDASKILI